MVLALYDADACQQLVLAKLVRAQIALAPYLRPHAGLQLYDAYTCQQLALANLVSRAWSWRCMMLTHVNSSYLRAHAVLVLYDAET